MPVHDALRPPPARAGRVLRPVSLGTAEVTDWRHCGGGAARQRTLGCHLPAPSVTGASALRRCLEPRGQLRPASQPATQPVERLGGAALLHHEQLILLAAAELGRDHDLVLARPDAHKLELVVGLQAAHHAARLGRELRRQRRVLHRRLRVQRAAHRDAVAVDHHHAQHALVRLQALEGLLHGRDVGHGAAAKAAAAVLAAAPAPAAACRPRRAGNGLAGPACSCPAAWQRLLCGRRAALLRSRSNTSRASRGRRDSWGEDAGLDQARGEHEGGMHMARGCARRRAPVPLRSSTRARTPSPPPHNIRHTTPTPTTLPPTPAQHSNMVSVRAWLAEHPPALWLRCLEVVVRALNVLLLVLGLGVTAWAVATVVQIGAEQRAHPAPRPPDTKAPPWLADVPWFLPAFGALGAATALTAGVALLGTRLRSPGCMSSSIFGMCLLLTGQACAAVAFFMDRGWQRRLPEIDEQLKQFLAQRLQVCKWVGVGLMLLQLLVLLLGCWLQSVYVAAEEAAEDADDEAAWRRRPLLQQHARRAASPGVGAAGAAADAAGDDSDGWRQRMSERYGLDTRQFTYRPGSSAGGHDAGGQQGAGRSRGCVVM